MVVVLRILNNINYEPTLKFQNGGLFQDGRNRIYNSTYIAAFYKVKFKVKFCMVVVLSVSKNISYEPTLKIQYDWYFLQDGNQIIKINIIYTKFYFKFVMFALLGASK